MDDRNPRWRIDPHHESLLMQPEETFAQWLSLVSSSESTAKPSNPIGEGSPGTNYSKGSNAPPREWRISLVKPTDAEPTDAETKIAERERILYEREAELLRREQLLQQQWQALEQSKRQFRLKVDETNLELEIRDRELSAREQILCNQWQFLERLPCFPANPDAPPKP